MPAADAVVDHLQVESMVSKRSKQSYLQLQHCWNFRRSQALYLLNFEQVLSFESVAQIWCVVFVVGKHAVDVLLLSAGVMEVGDVIQLAVVDIR